MEGRQVFLIERPDSTVVSNVEMCRINHVFALAEGCYSIPLVSGSPIDESWSELTWSMRLIETTSSLMLDTLLTGKPGMANTWRENYTYAMNQFVTTSYAPIPDDHVFFRTTSVRHFNPKEGDWNTKFKARNDRTRMNAVWVTSGVHI
jgi:hypothetical protein